jgi:hypothetical protein
MDLAVDVPFDLTETSEALARTPVTLRRLIEELPDTALVYREAPNAWTPIEVLCHLADGEITDWMPRVKVIVSAAADRRFAPYDREGGFARYRGWDAPALLDEFERRRGENLATLDAFHIEPGQLGATGIHPEFGAVTLEQLLATWITHDFAHLSQISRIGTRFFGRHVGPWTKYFSLLGGK